MYVKPSLAFLTIVPTVSAGQPGGGPVHVGRLLEEGAPAGALHVAAGQRAPAGAGAALPGPAGRRARYQRLRAHLLQKHR